MKKTLCVVLLLCYIFSGFGQVVDTAAVVREVDSLLKVADGLARKGNLKEAVSIVERAAESADNGLGKKHIKYIGCLNALGAYNSNLGNYEASMKWLLEGKSIWETIGDTNHTTYATLLSNLGSTYRFLGEYDFSERYLSQALRIREKKFGKNSIEYARTLLAFTGFHFGVGRYEEAIAIVLQVKDIVEKKEGKQHPEYSRCLNNLGVLYRYLREFESAEAMYLEAEQLRAVLLGKEHPEYGNVLNNLGVLYNDMGRYEEAKNLNLQALSLREKALGKDNPDYALSLNNLGQAYFYLGNFDAAEKMNLASLSIREKVLGKEHQDYAQSLNNLSEINKILGRFEASEKYLSEAMDIRRKKLGTEHPYYLSSMRDVIKLNLSKGLFELVSPQLEELLKKQKVIGETTLDYYEVLTLAGYYYSLKDSLDTASSYYEKSLQLIPVFFQNAARHSTEKDLVAYQTLFNKEIDAALSCLFNLDQPNPKAGTILNTALTTKRFLLEGKLSLQKTLNRLDSNAIGIYHRWLGFQRRLAIEYAAPPLERKNVQQMERAANDLEKELTRKVAGFNESSRQITWQEVQAALQPGEAALEFIHFNYYTPAPTDSVLYAALLLKPGMNQPLFIPIFEEKQLKALLPAGGDKLNMDQVNELYGNNALYDLVWSPLEPHLQGVRTVYYSPGGLLHRLNLAALPAGGQTTLADRYDIVTLGSTRQLVVNNKPEATRSSTALVYGGIQFETDSKANTTPTGMPTGNRGSIDFSAVDSTLRNLPVYEAGWDYLKGSEKEADNVKSVLTKAGYTAEVLKGGQASEESFKKIGQGEPSPRILHVSTHGYFFPDPKVKSDSRQAMDGSSPVFKISDHPMIRSGLILAGANHAWKTGKPLGNREDGVLTAYEISQLDLRNTELVVLSACETGLGQIEGNEGVYGLQRAFKIAGAKNLIMSLWQVPDNQTLELMTYFYQKLLLEKMPVRQALRAAQAEMRRQRYEPFYWAGFVVVE